MVALDAMPQDLDPRFATDASSSRIDRLVFRSLTLPDAQAQHVPDVALDWKSESPTAVVFRLRSDVVFHDGTPLGADDVRATYESILDPATGSPKREELAFLESVEAVDEHTVRFRLREPYAAFLDATTIGLLPRAALRGTDRVTVGAGPFRIGAVVPGHEVELEAVPGHGGLRAIVFRVVPDDTVRALEVAKGSVHFVENAIEPEGLGWLRGHAHACIDEIPGTTFQYLGLNLRDERLKDRRVRQAIALAIDRDALVRDLLKGTARPATGLLAPSHWAYQGDVRRYGRDLGEARRLLDAAGRRPAADGVRFHLSYKTTPLESRRRVAEAIQAELAEVGIALDVRSFEWATFYDDVRRGNFEIYSLAWVGVTDPDVYFNLLSSSSVPPHGNNRGGYANPEIDRLVLAGRRTLDPVERRRIYGDVQRIVAEDLPFIPLWWSDTVVVRDPRLCGFVPSPDGDLGSLRTAWWSERSGATPPARRPSPCGCAAAS